MHALLDAGDPRTRLAAIRLVLDAALRHREHVTLEERIQALEETDAARIEP